MFTIENMDRHKRNDHRRKWQSECRTLHKTLRAGRGAQEGREGLTGNVREGGYVFLTTFFDIVFRYKGNGHTQCLRRH